MSNDRTTEQISPLVDRAEVGERLSLVVYVGEHVRVLPLRDALVVGRGAESDLALDDRSLSRRHVRFERVEAGVRVEDLASTNGTFRRGERLLEPSVLRPGEAVTLGSIVISVNGISPADGQVRGVESYDRLLRRIDDELVRARTFLRGVAVLMLRRTDDTPAAEWMPRMFTHLRPVDRVTRYGTREALIVLPETDRARAEKVARALLAEDPRARVGVAFGGASAEVVVDTARTLARRATSDSRLGMEARDAAVTTDVPVFRSACMVELDELVDRVAQARIPVLLQGETGSGKEVVARAIHGRGPRADGPLRAVNCGAMPTTLLEALLFGHERGSFTGADSQTPGLFEQADGGTLFLDEVAELSAAAQAALLRILEAKTIRRLGGTKDIPVDVRLIVATHRDLGAMVRDGAFREDLFFRLDVMKIVIPPLRERAEDLDPLIDRFFEEACAELGVTLAGIECEARELLHGYRWPGNVRELRNVIDRAVVVCRADRIGPSDLPPRVTGPPPRPASDTGAEDEEFKDRVRAFEVDLIEDALERCEGNRTEAARLLRIPIRTLSYKIRSYGIEIDG